MHLPFGIKKKKYYSEEKLKERRRDKYSDRIIDKQDRSTVRSARTLLYMPKIVIRSFD